MGRSRDCCCGGCAQGEDEEGETDELVNSVLDEIGIDLNGLMVPAPGQQAAVAEQPQASSATRPTARAAAASTVSMLAAALKLK